MSASPRCALVGGVLGAAARATAAPCAACSTCASCCAMRRPSALQVVATLGQQRRRAEMLARRARLRRAAPADRAVQAGGGVGAVACGIERGEQACGGLRAPFRCGRRRAPAPASSRRRAPAGDRSASTGCAAAVGAAGAGSTLPSSTPASSASVELDAPAPGRLPASGARRCRPCRSTSAAVVGAQRRVARDGGMEAPEQRRPACSSSSSISVRSRLQAERAEQFERRGAQQLREPGVEGADLDRPAGCEHAPRAGRAAPARRAAAASTPRPRSRSACASSSSGVAGDGELRQPLVEALAHLAGRLAGEGDGQDLLRLRRRRAARAGCARPASRSCRRRRRPRRRSCSARVAGDGVERLARDRPAVAAVGRRLAARARSAGRRSCAGGRPVVAPAQAARVAVLADRILRRAPAARRRRAAARSRGRCRRRARRRWPTRRHARPSGCRRGRRARGTRRAPHRRRRVVAVSRLASPHRRQQRGVERELGVLERLPAARLRRRCSEVVL